MPIYEYECTDCGHELEVMRKISDAPLTACPTCRKDALQKIISKVTFRLKGTGWYETDFKDKPSATKTKKEDKPDKDASAESKGDTGKENKTDTAQKPAPKAEE